MYMYSSDFEPYENDLEERGNQEAWEDAQLEMEQDSWDDEDDDIIDEDEDGWEDSDLDSGWEDDGRWDE